MPSLHNRRERILMTGELTSPIDPPPECRFASRCRFAQDCHRARISRPRHRNMAEKASC